MTTADGTRAGRRPDVRLAAATARSTARQDRVLLAVFGVVVAGLVVWGMALILSGLPVSLLGWTGSLIHLLIGAIGAFIVLRTDARRLGWLLVLQTLFLTSYIGAGVFEQTGATWAGVMEALGGMPLGFLMAATILYPTGHAESRILAVLVALCTWGITVGSGHWLGVNLGWWDPIADPLDLVINLTTVPLFASFFEQARIYRRRPPIQQKQVKWYLIGLLAVPMYAIPGVLGLSEDVFLVMDAIATILFPIAILVGITKYHLYEIDRLVSRTVGYVLVVGMLAGVTVGSVALLTTVLPSRDQFVTAAVTVLVVALSRPLRRRVLDAVDRRFDRRKYVAQQVVEDFGRDIQDQTDLEAVRARVHAVLSQTLAPSSVAMWEPGAVASQAAR